MSQQLGDPVRVGDVRLATGHVLHVPGIAQHDLDASLQHAVDRQPVHARTFHRHMRALSLDEPVSQSSEISGKGSERTRDDRRRVAPPIETTGHDPLFVYIQTGSNLHYDFHDTLLSKGVEARTLPFQTQNLLYVLVRTLPNCDKRWYLWQRGTSLPDGALSASVRVRPLRASTPLKVVPAGPARKPRHDLRRRWSAAGRGGPPRGRGSVPQRNPASRGSTSTHSAEGPG